MLALETENRHAFELVMNAIGAIDRYKRSRDRQVLDSALAKLTQAQRHDEQYMLVPYYMAVVEDLLGRSRDAAERLRAILSETPKERYGLINEMRFNLAVAEYHGYSHDNLRAAAETLDKILSDTGTLFRRLKYYRLRLYSRALLAQVHAMWSIPRRPEDVVIDSIECDRVKSCYKRSVFNAYKVFFSPMQLLLAVFDYARLREIKAIACNSLGMAAMYYTDFFLNQPRKTAKLQRGLKRLTKSDLLFPRDWANYCDIGSCHMRLGFWGKDAKEFELARKYLTDVIEVLRPGYGFALYEIGRSYRIQACFQEALEYFGKAEQVPERDREVSDRRLNREIGLAKEQNSLYP
jgi:tetratricopeptide (TPR) repeat protein